MSSDADHLLHAGGNHSFDYSQSGETDMGMSLEEANRLLGISSLNPQAATQVSGFPPPNSATPTTSYNDTVQFDDGMFISDFVMGHAAYLSNVQNSETNVDWTENPMFVGVPGINVIEDVSNQQDSDSNDNAADQSRNHLQPCSVTSFDAGVRSRSASPSSVRSSSTFSNPDKVKKKGGRQRGSFVGLLTKEEELLLLKKDVDQTPEDKAAIRTLLNTTSSRRFRKKRAGKMAYYTQCLASYADFVTTLTNDCKDMTKNEDGTQTESQKRLAELLEKGIALRDAPEPDDFSSFISNATSNVVSNVTNFEALGKAKREQQKSQTELQIEQKKNKFNEQLMTTLIRRYPSWVGILDGIASEILGASNSSLNRDLRITVENARFDVEGTISKVLESQIDS